MRREPNETVGRVTLIGCYQNGIPELRSLSLGLGDTLHRVVFKQGLIP